MTRAIAIISCLIASLFLVPVQADCLEIYEGESETAIECCVIANGMSRAEISEDISDNRINIPRSSRDIDVSSKVKIILPHLSVRILHCVFRE